MLLPQVAANEAAWLVELGPNASEKQLCRLPQQHLSATRNWKAALASQEGSPNALIQATS